MAHARQETGPEKRVVTVTPGQPQIVLTLSMAEAQALRLVAARVGGDPDTTRRGAIQQVDRALELAGVVRNVLEYTHGMTGGVSFSTITDFTKAAIESVKKDEADRQRRQRMSAQATQYVPWYASAGSSFGYPLYE